VRRVGYGALNFSSLSGYTPRGVVEINMFLIYKGPLIRKVRVNEVLK
jgi:hypothetical protein